MKETGIIMSGEHPRLILDGLKTMTRRVIKPQPIIQDYQGKYSLIWKYSPNWSLMLINQPSLEVCLNDLIAKCPYGQVGDLLVIKETWATENRYNHLKPSDIPRTARIYYLADGGYSPYEMGKVRSAMFMCHWMSRAKPEITEIRAERLQEITEEDTVAEGVIRYPAKIRQGVVYRALSDYTFEAYPLKWGFKKGERLRADYPSLGHARFYSIDEKNGQCIHLSPKEAFSLLEDEAMTYREAFVILWDSLNAKRGYGWDRNNWVFSIGFRVVDR